MDKRYIFDITTVIQWAGPSVGIVRVERELARRARQHLGQNVIFCVYSRALKSFFRVKDEYVNAICRGEHSLTAAELNPEAADTQAAAIIEEIFLHTQKEFKTAESTAMDTGTSTLPLDKALQLRSQLYKKNWGKGERRKIYHYLIDGIIDDLNEDDVIISVGLDWEYKDLHDIRQQKEKKGFEYHSLVHDLIPLEFPHFVVPSYQHLLKGYFGELFWMADKCIANSRTTLAAISDHLTRWHLPSMKLGAFHLGCDIPAVTKTMPPPPELVGKKFALYVSTIEPRKNHRVIYEAYQHAVETGKIDPDECCVVFVGHTGWNVNNLIDEIKANPVTRDHFFIYEAVTDEFLLSLYQEARMVVFPSFYEGFGLSLVEALGLGKACIASDTSALVEVADGNALHIPARDTISWASALTEFYNKDEVIQDAEERARRGKIHSWDLSAAEFFQVVKEA